LKNPLTSKNTFDTNRIDADGFREVVLIGNESPIGCPFKCKACGVFADAELVTSNMNKKIITKEISILNNKIQSNLAEYKKTNFHLLVYNFGNITNIDELSIENLGFLLHEIGRLPCLPKYISINSRGRFLTKDLLIYIKSLHLKYDVNFIIGIESLSEKGAMIYGKKNIKKEFQVMYDLVSSFNLANETNFGFDTSFVFLPEFYDKNRTDKLGIKNGFENDLMSFIKLYVGKNVPIKISIHPYFKTQNYPYDSTYNFFEIIIDVICNIKKILINLNKGVHNSLQNTIFIGIKDKGYETEGWIKELDKWGHIIEEVNKGDH